MRRGSRRAVTRAVALALSAVGALALAIAVMLPGAAANAASASKGTTIMTVSGPLGPMLVVGSGKYLGYTVYMITSDVPPSYGCTTEKVKLPGGSGSGLACTGPSSDQSAEWPAVTTTGAPVAGAGVNAKLLGTVKRPGIGDQVTYNGHPLYLFDMSPGQITGEAWVEPGLPPWHGAWYVVSPAGTPLAWPNMLTELTVKGKQVLAVVISTLAGIKADPVYSYSKDSSSTSACTGSCAVAWPPVLTDGSPGVESPLAASKVGTLRRADGTEQVTYDGKPLYFYSLETPTKVVADDGLAFVAGNGSGLKVGGGTFQLVTP
jgi:predicted lipoprotein with Yx(FWY)xxD motif